MRISVDDDDDGGRNKANRENEKEDEEEGIKRCQMKQPAEKRGGRRRRRGTRKIHTMLGIFVERERPLLHLCILLCFFLRLLLDEKTINIASVPSR